MNPNKEGGNSPSPPDQIASKSQGLVMPADDILLDLIKSQPSLNQLEAGTRSRMGEGVEWMDTHHQQPVGNDNNPIGRSSLDPRVH